jgi:phosphoadenosine phosphosulfate reductase
MKQLQFTADGRITDKVELAIQRLKSFEPPEGYYVAFSGGKDSQCVYHLCKMGGVKFDAHYAVTSVDPPELVRFIKRNYPDVSFDRQHDKDGKPITMWSLIASHTLPPTRKVRYCCAHLKEPGGEGRIVVTGVRWAESINRKATHGIVGFRGKPVGTKKIADEIGAEYKLNKHGDVIMNDDNDANRRMVEQCYRTRKTMVNPIVDWTDEDVWDFLNENGIEHCCLYDEGFTRLGCIGCPLSGSKNMIRDFERWPKYKELYIRAFQRMIDNHPGQIKILDPNADTKFKLYDGVPENYGGGYSGIGSTKHFDDSPDVEVRRNIGGGAEHTSRPAAKQCNGISTDGRADTIMRFYLTNCN